MTKHSIIRGPQLDYPTSRETGKVMTTHEHIEARAAATPQKIAIRYHEESVDYRTLMLSVNSMVDTLQKRGVQKADHVAIYGHRNIDYCIAMLGIFKIGAIYTPLDPVSSQRYTSNVLNSFPAVYVIVTNDLTTDEIKKIKAISRQSEAIQLIDFDVNQTGEIDVIDGIELEDIRYAIPTSGSTGKPKCVLIHEQSMLLQNLAKIQDLALTENDVVGQTTTQTFDVHIWQILTPLMIGATVVVLDRCQADAPKILLQEISEKNISIIELVPSILGILLNDLEQARDQHNIYQSNIEQLRSLRYLAVTGEALPPKHCQRWFNYFSNNSNGIAPPIVNMFGPTECGDDVAHCIIRNQSDSEYIIMPICRKPISNTTFYLLNDEGELVDDGDEAILHVGGDAVGLGYLGDHEKTTAAFCEHKIQNEHVRLYNTGDRVYYRDGHLFYLGRVANSYVKLAGRRVELSSFSNQLQEHSGVSQAVTAKIPDRSAVVTYVTLTPAFIAEIKQQLEEEQSTSIADVFDRVVQDGVYDDDFNHGGWNNYMPGVAFSGDAVRENLQDARSYIDRFISRSTSVLEVGCGSGMLAKQTAVNAKCYIGTDISSQSIAIASRSCDGLNNVSFYVCDADQLQEQFSDSKFDIIFFNAVVNYFACPEKLERVLQQAASLLNPGGKLLILDVYHIACQELIHCEFEYLRLRQRNRNHLSTVDELRQHIQKSVMWDPDLFLHPGFFAELIGKLPNVKSIQCHLKSGVPDDQGLPNPMVRYRYGVILDTQEEKNAVEELPMKKFGVDYSSVKELCISLSREQPLSVHLTEIPNSRTIYALRLLTMIGESGATDSINILAPYKGIGGVPIHVVDPMQLVKQAEAVGYRVDNMLFSSEDVSYFEAILTRTDQAMHYSLSVNKSDRYPLSNSPLLQRVLHEATSRLEATLKKQSQYATYCSIVVVPEMLRTTNGKIDLEALIITYQSKVGAATSSLHYFTDAYTSYEHQLKGIILPFLTQGSPTADINKETFFSDIGLRSIDLTSLLAQVNRHFHLDLPLEVVMNNACLRSLAETIEHALTQDHTGTLAI